MSRKYRMQDWSLSASFSLGIEAGGPFFQSYMIETDNSRNRGFYGRRAGIGRGRGRAGGYVVSVSLRKDVSVLVGPPVQRAFAWDQRIVSPSPTSLRSPPFPKRWRGQAYANKTLPVPFLQFLAIEGRRGQRNLDSNVVSQACWSPRHLFR
jgi:hypothetical protein